jgi:predicted DNA binding CopG/RHH family protein
MEVRRRRQARAGSVRSIRQGHLPQGSSAEHRLSSKDLEAIQKRALAEGLPYQTLIASLLHKHAAGRLKEV